MCYQNTHLYIFPYWATWSHHFVAINFQCYSISWICLMPSLGTNIYIWKYIMHEIWTILIAVYKTKSNHKLKNVGSRCKVATTQAAAHFSWICIQESEHQFEFWWHCMQIRLMRHVGLPTRWPGQPVEGAGAETVVCNQIVAYYVALDGRMTA